MSESPARRSLAPIGAEDDGDSGTKSVPAMLRLVKDCLARHTQCVTDAVSAVAEPGTLSTVTPYAAFVASCCLQGFLHSELDVASGVSAEQR